MEDEETGELFIPCRVCSHKCFNKHGKYHDKQCFDGSACFFKVMLGDFAERLVTFILKTSFSSFSVMYSVQNL